MNTSAEEPVVCGSRETDSKITCACIKEKGHEPPHRCHQHAHQWYVGVEEQRTRPDYEALQRQLEEAVGLLRRIDGLLTDQDWVQAEEDLTVLEGWQKERSRLALDVRAFLARQEPTAPRTEQAPPA